MKKLIGMLKNILFLPLVLAVDIFRSSRGWGGKIGYLLFTIVFFIPSWIRGYTISTVLAKQSLYQLGVVDRLTKIPVEGDSMLPTIESGIDIELHSPKKYQIRRGDIVSFRNIKTGGMNYLKRIVGLPGEKVAIKNGFVFINNRILKEDYVFNDLPTYGNEFLIDCNSYSIPSNHYLVLGDNRTVSFDSRALGFISKKDINGVIKMNLTDEFLSGGQSKRILKGEVNKDILIEKINQQREANHSNPLLSSGLLNQVAESRVDLISQFFDN